MSKKIFFFISVFLCLTRESLAYYDFDKKLEQAYSLIFSLRLNEAGTLLQQEKTEKPGNDLRILYLNYIDFLKAFISEESQEYERLKKNTSLRLTELNRNKDNQDSPFHLYVQSEMLIQQALVGIKFNENINPASDIRKSYKLIKKNEEIFPAFIPNRKITAFLHTIVGAVPDRYKWMVKLTGMEGTVVQGTGELLLLYESIGDSPFSSFRTEILFYLGYIYSNISKSDESKQLLAEMKSMSDKSQLIAFVYSNIMMKLGKNDEAYNVLNNSLKNDSVYPFVFLHYKRGLTRLRKMDLSAEQDFEYYLTHYKGSNNVKAAHQKLGWIALIKGDTIKYFNEFQQCINTGFLNTEEDRLVFEEAESKELVNVFLLRSRLFFDGGYYKASLSEVTGKTIESFPRFRDQLEITYRLGRIMQMTGQNEKAIKYFEITLKNGISSKYYFAANSSLMLGLIYEESKQYDMAGMYFQKCLSIKHDQYKNSIDQKAKAGLDRLKSKNKLN